MKPFKHCPVCKVPLDKFQHNENWLEEHCPKGRLCPIKYHQYYLNSFNDEEISYITFYTKNFLVYAYFNSHNGHRNIFHIYHREFLRGETRQSPAFKVEAFEIDFDNIDQLNKRWLTWDIFS